jgi:hypothetical protein
MKIYHNARIVAVLKRFIPKKGGDWLNRLVGIDLEESRQGDIHVFPVYRSWRFRHMPEGLFFETPLLRKQLVILIGKGGCHFDLVPESQLHLSDVGKTEQEEE